MSQQTTTKEFAARLVMAVDGHPLAPASPFGRQSWLREKLKNEAKTPVSANSVHKWMNGTARPREDKIRALARILGVDELWLSMGKSPASKSVEAETQVQGKAAVLLLAGLIEMNGGRVTFLGDEQPGDLHANIGNRQITIIVVTPDSRGTSQTVVVSEPVGNARIVAVCPAANNHTVGIDLFDLTAAPRQSFGGYSIIQLERRKDGKMKAEGVRGLFGPLDSVLSLVD